MSTRYQAPTGAKRELAERLFEAIAHTRELTHTPEDDAPAPVIAFSRLYAYAVDPAVDDAELGRALETDPQLWADFHSLLERTATDYLPRVAAASSGPVLSRDGEGCRIRFEQSRAEPNQTYVIIELADKRGDPPSSLLILDSHNQCHKFVLPQARDGVIQMLVEQSSDLLEGLLDIKTEVFLR